MPKIYYKSGSSWVNALSLFYPVGAVYLSYSSTNPGSIFGGSWSALATQKYLVTGLSSNTSWQAGDLIGGEGHSHWVTLPMCRAQDEAGTSAGYGLPNKYHIDGLGFAGRPLVFSGTMGDQNVDGVLTTKKQIRKSTDLNNTSDVDYSGPGICVYAFRRTA